MKWAYWTRLSGTQGWRRRRGVSNPRYVDEHVGRRTASGRLWLQEAKRWIRGWRAPLPAALQASSLVLSALALDISDSPGSATGPTNRCRRSNCRVSSVTIEFKRWPVRREWLRTISCRSLASIYPPPSTALRQMAGCRTKAPYPSDWTRKSPPSPPHPLSSPGEVGSMAPVLRSRA